MSFRWCFCAQPNMHYVTVTGSQPGFFHSVSERDAMTFMLQRTSSTLYTPNIFPSMSRTLQTTADFFIHPQHSSQGLKHLCVSTTSSFNQSPSSNPASLVSQLSFHRRIRVNLPMLCNSNNSAIINPPHDALDSSESFPHVQDLAIDLDFCPHGNWAKIGYV